MTHASHFDGDTLTLTSPRGTIVLSQGQCASIVIMAEKNGPVGMDRLARLEADLRQHYHLHASPPDGDGLPVSLAVLPGDREKAAAIVAEPAAQGDAGCSHSSVRWDGEKAVCNWCDKPVDARVLSSVEAASIRDNVGRVEQATDKQGDEAAVEALRNLTMQEGDNRPYALMSWKGDDRATAARAILAAIRRGKVPGAVSEWAWQNQIKAERLMRDAFAEREAHLRAKLAKMKAQMLSEAGKFLRETETTERLRAELEHVRASLHDGPGATEAENRRLKTELEQARRDAASWCDRSKIDRDRADKSDAACDAARKDAEALAVGLCGVMSLPYPPTAADLDAMRDGVNVMAAAAPDPAATRAALAAAEALRRLVCK